MIILRYYFLICGFFLSMLGNAQGIDSVEERSKLRWINSFQLRNLYEANYDVVSRLSVRYMIGVEREKVTIALGTGFDDYAQYHTVPVFVDVKYAVFNKKNTPFAYSQGGYGFAIEKYSNGYVSNPVGGVMMGAGVGMLFKQDKADLLLSVGYQYQRVSALYQGYPYYFWNTIDAVNTMEIIRKMNRITLAVGIRF